MPDVRRRILKATVHELRSVDPVGHDGLARGQVDSPSERHAVGNEMINSFRAPAEVRIGQAQHCNMRVREIHNGRLLRRATVEYFGKILVRCRCEQGLAEEDGVWKLRTHGIRKAEKLKS